MQLLNHTPHTVDQVRWFDFTPCNDIQGYLLKGLSHWRIHLKWQIAFLGKCSFLSAWADVFVFNFIYSMWSHRNKLSTTNCYLCICAAASSDALSHDYTVSHSYGISHGRFHKRSCFSTWAVKNLTGRHMSWYHSTGFVCQLVYRLMVLAKEAYNLLGVDGKSRKSSGNAVVAVTVSRMIQSAIWLIWSIQSRIY